MNSVVGLCKAMRPRQWVKNLLVFLPLLFAVDLVWSPTELMTLLAYAPRLAALFAAFCALSSAVYIINDLVDREADRQHPTKRFRPIASGDVSPALAWAAFAALVVAGMVGLYAISAPPYRALAVIGAVYLLVNVAYSLRLKRVALVDVMLVAAGYVMRAVAGAVAVGATPSPWLYAVTAAGALFIVIGRRYAEARLAGPDPDAQRPTLQHYGPPVGGQLLVLSATAALVSYTLYAVEADNLPDNNTMLLTVPLVIFGLFRYLYLLNHSRDAESPEILMLRDVPLLLSIAAWVVVAGGVLVLN
ncbi:MAG: decaprenyl-phosphate phosphoribosyltransferase [Chloroflexota bacterium]|nr:decaprenyl-phosphate phosphoribosyltransferase [Chloroflexota bacterium]MDE2683838.1 decaprenyl-phosphate phosphoribosyltransferase [Chloroflexota bacterium]